MFNAGDDVIILSTGIKKKIYAVYGDSQILLTDGSVVSVTGCKLAQTETVAKIYPTKSLSSFRSDSWIFKGIKKNV